MAGADALNPADPSGRLRHSMVERDIVRRGISDERVIQAMRTVPRERFVPGAEVEHAYADSPVPLGHGQTVSQPYVVAWMAQLARIDSHHRVLEVGAGSGYAAAVLAELAGAVVAMESIPELAASARIRLKDLGYHNVEVVAGDGSDPIGLEGPFDAIVVSAAAPAIPLPLRELLATGGRMVVPVGARGGQRLVVVERTASGFRQRNAGAVAFVPLVGRSGWDAPGF